MLRMGARGRCGAALWRGSARRTFGVGSIAVTDKTVRRTLEVADPGCLDVFGEGIVAGLVIILVILAAVFLVIPLLVAVFDVGLVLVAAMAGVLVRIVLRRPWTVEARASDRETRRWRVIGWRTSGRRCTEISEQLAAGVVPSPTPHRRVAGLSAPQRRCCLGGQTAPVAVAPRGGPEVNEASPPHLAPAPYLYRAALRASDMSPNAG